MVRISNSEQISLALKARLQKLKSAKKPGRSIGSDKVEPAPHAPSDPLQELAFDDALDEQEIEQALVRTILAQEFGTETAADPRFEQVVHQVGQILQADEDGKALIQTALRELRDKE